MDGFALDFYYNSKWQTGRELPDDETQSIGGVFTPETSLVINTLAEQYAVFTHWHCDAPTCTFPNHTFLHAGTSKGRVDNNITFDYAWDNNLPNLFTRMTDQGVPWKAYFDASQVVPFESINLGGLHHRKLWKTHSAHMEHFYADAARGTLPRYSWVEPCMLFGGCYDHVPPPASISPDGIVEQEGLRFDRMGVRVPTIVISAHTERGTVITDLHTNTSMTRTLRESLGLGGAFTRRDAWAAPIEAAFNRAEPRRDMYEIDPQPYVAGSSNPRYQAIHPGDMPTVKQAIYQRKELGKEYVSELGEATMGAAAALLGKHPEDAPLAEWQKTTRFYETVQGYLRGTTGISPATQGHLEGLLDAVRGGRVTTDVRLFRGLRDWSTVFDSLEPETTAPAVGLLATTVDERVALQEFARGKNPALLRLRLRDPSRAAWVAGAGDPRLRNQGEILMPEDANLRIVGLSGYASYVPVLDVEVWW